MAGQLAAITSAQATLIAGSSSFVGGAFYFLIQESSEDVLEELEDIRDAMPDAIDVWTGEIVDDCTLMLRHDYLGFSINKLQLEDCENATGAYYDRDG